MFIEQLVRRVRWRGASSLAKDRVRRAACAGGSRAGRVCAGRSGELTGCSPQAPCTLPPCPHQDVGFPESRDVAHWGPGSTRAHSTPWGTHTVGRQEVGEGGARGWVQVVKGLTGQQWGGAIASRQLLLGARWTCPWTMQAPRRWPRLSAVLAVSLSRAEEAGGGAASRATIRFLLPCTPPTTLVQNRGP